MLNVETFCLGELDTNAYLVSPEGSSQCWVIDCPGQPESLLQALKRRTRAPECLVLTHAHVDHMAGLNDFRDAFPHVPVFQHALEASWLANPEANLSAWMGTPITAAAAQTYLVEGQVLSLDGLTVKVLHLPGHSPGSIGLWFESSQELFSGDVLFRSGVGRWDFPGCDVKALRSSLDRVTNLPSETRVRPGHGGSTTVGREKTSNPYLRSDAPWL